MRDKPAARQRPRPDARISSAGKFHSIPPDCTCDHPSNQPHHGIRFSANIERWPLERLIPHARNARTHSEEQVAQIAGSIAEFGFVNPVLVGDDGVIVAGHGRVMAARKLGLSEAPVIVLSHLTPTQRRALMIADNQIATQAGWNDEMLAAELALKDDAFERNSNRGAV